MDLRALQIACEFFIYFWSCSYLVMFMAFFLKADMAATMFFGQNPRKVLAESQDATMKEHICLAHIYHRMEASFGVGQGAIALATVAIWPSLEVMSGLLLGITVSNLMVLINHSVNASGKWAFGTTHNDKTRKAFRVMILFAGSMFVWSLILCVIAFSQAFFLSFQVKYVKFVD